MPQLNITQKFIAYLMLFSVIPLVVVGVISYTTSTTLLRQENERYTRQLVDNQLEYLQLQQGQIESLIANISGVEAIRNTLQSSSTSADSYARLSTQAQIGYILNGYINIQGLVSIDIFTLDGTHYSVGDTLVTDNIREDVRDSVFNQAVNSGQSITWIGIENNVNIDSDYQQVVTAASILYQFDRATLEQKPIAALMINFDANYLYDHFRTVDLGENAYLMVMDRQGRLIYHPDRTRIGTMLDTTLRDQFTGDSGTLATTFDAADMAISYARPQDSDWTVISVVPVATFTAKAASIRNVMLITLLVSFIIIAMLAVLYNRNVVAPIRELISRFQRLQHEPPDQQERLEQRSKDEIGELVQLFNLFLDNLIERRKVAEEREHLIEDLRVANQKAEESTRLKSEFLATMSHEFRTPLNAIEGFTSIMLGDMGIEVSPQARHMLERISLNSQRLLEIVSDVLDLSRIEAGKFTLAHQPFAPAELATAWQRQLSSLAQQKQIAFEVQIDPALPDTLYGDAAAISRITTNLLGNALKFTHQGGRVALRLKPQDTNWIIEVTDTGIGIPKEAQAYIFEEFRQVDQSSKRAYGGTGLGLAIVQRLVRVMEGSIKVHSIVNQGSTFTVTLPLHLSYEMETV